MIKTDLSTVMLAFVELNDLKRIFSSDREGSIATRLFREAWSALVGGAAADKVAGWITGRALAAARLGDIDMAALTEAGVPRLEAQTILMSAAEAVGGTTLETVRRRIENNLTVPLTGDSPCPAFVTALSRQPRAGITCPGKPRILLEPAENHADHCLMVAVYGVLLSDHYEADPGRVFLAALAHHFHNAGMPDSGFTGEVLLGPHLETVMAYHKARCLAQLAPALRAEVEHACAMLPDADPGPAFDPDVERRIQSLLQALDAEFLERETRVLARLRPDLLALPGSFGRGRTDGLAAAEAQRDTVLGERAVGRVEIDVGEPPPDRRLLA